MKRKHVILAIMAVILFSIGYPLYRVIGEKIEFTNTIAELRHISFVLTDYSKARGEYPKTLQEIGTKEYLGNTRISASYLDETITSYFRPESLETKDDFIMLSRPLSSGKVIVRKDSSYEVLDKNGNVRPSYNESEPTQEEIKEIDEYYKKQEDEKKKKS